MLRDEETLSVLAPEMTLSREEFAAELERLGLSQAGFGRLVERYGGAPPAPTTVNRWVTGKVPVPSWAVAVAGLFGELPERRRARILEELERHRGRPRGSAEDR